jgi:hypothetical protein
LTVVIIPKAGDKLPYWPLRCSRRNAVKDKCLDGDHYTKSRRRVVLPAVEELETERSEGQMSTKLTWIKSMMTQS